MPTTWSSTPRSGSSSAAARLRAVLQSRPSISEHPIDILKLWDGGMSFHGGVIGTSLGILYFARKEKLPWLRIHDYVACCVPFGLFFGRLANFVNQELWGAPTQCAVGGPLRRSRRRYGPMPRPAAPPEPALRGGPRRHRPVRDPRLDVLEDPGALRAGQARRRLHLLLRAVPLRHRVHPRARQPADRLRPGDRPAHGPVAVAADDPRRALPDADRQEAPGARRADRWAPLSVA